MSTSTPNLTFTFSHRDRKVLVTTTLDGRVLEALEERWSRVEVVDPDCLNESIGRSSDFYRALQRARRVALKASSTLVPSSSLSVRQAVEADQAAPEDFPASSYAEIRRNKKRRTTQCRQRLFTDEFALDDRVFIIRHEHGWPDGAYNGKITRLTPTYAEVTDDCGSVFEINHPRDISLISRGLNWKKNKS